MVLAMGCAGIQIERFAGQLLGFPPIAFDGRVRLLDQSIGQNRAGQRIVFIQLVGLAQQLDSVGRFLLRAQILTFGHQAVSFASCA